MKIFILLLCIFFSLNSFSQEFDRLNIELLGRWTIPVDKVEEFGTKHSSCWGYAQEGREYAIVSCSNGTAYIDITDPSFPEFIDFVESDVKNATWREYKTYKHYAYQISDDQGANHFDIVDMSYLPDSVHVAYKGSSEYFKTGHTIFIEGDFMYIGALNKQSMAVFSLLEDPERPKLLRTLSQDHPGYVHDMFVRNDTIYASMGTVNGLKIFVYKEDKFTLLGSFTNYPFTGFNHSCILTPDGKTLIFTDEVPPNLPAKSLDVSDPANPVLVDTFYSQTRKATLHNPFLAYNNTFVMASNADGVQVFDFSDPAEIKMRGYFDTHYQSGPDNTNGGNFGAWSAYTQLPSKNLVVVDRQNGLFVLDATKAYFPVTSVDKSNRESIKISSYPNPSENNFQIEIPGNITGKLEVKIFSTAGNMIYHNIMEAQVLKQHKFSAGNWPAGVYLIQLIQEEKVFIAEQMIK